MDNIERKIEITREKLANLEEEYEKKFWKKDTQKSEKNFIQFYNCPNYDIFTMTDSQISYFINEVRNRYDAYNCYENENGFRISPVQDEKCKIHLIGKSLRRAKSSENCPSQGPIRESEYSPVVARQVVPLEWSIIFGSRNCWICSKFSNVLKCAKSILGGRQI